MVKVVASIVTDKQELSQTDSQVTATVCVQLQPNVEKQNSATTLRLKFKLDTHFGRATFLSDRTKERVWEVPASETQHCEDFELIITPKTEFVFKPLELELHYENVNVPSASSPGESPARRRNQFQ